MILSTRRNVAQHKTMPLLKFSVFLIGDEWFNQREKELERNAFARGGLKEEASASQRREVCAYRRPHDAAFRDHFLRSRA
jgi:hypothetical protein